MIIEKDMRFIQFLKARYIRQLKHKKTILYIVDISFLRVNPFSAGIVFRRHNLTFVDVIFWRLKDDPALNEFEYF